MVSPQNNRHDDLPSTPDSPASARPEKRGRGRPGRISRELILQKSIEILDQTPVERFMIKTVALELGTGSMAIYNYFASRDDLLQAVAEAVCLQFVPPPAQPDWHETLLAWLRALRQHAERHPLMSFVIGINGQTSPAWVKTIAPVTVLLHDQLGLRDKKLALATYLFGSTSSTMSYVIAASRVGMRPNALPNLDGLGLDVRSLDILKKTPVHLLTRDEIFEALFAQLIAGIELLL